MLLLAVAIGWPVRADIDPAVPLDELALPQPGQVTDAPAADSATVIARARALLAVDDLAAAADLVDQALDRGTPRDYALLLLAAELRAELGSPGEARALAEYAASLRADPAEAYYLLGVLNRDTAPRRAAGAFWAAHAAAGPRHLPVHAAAALGQLATTLADLGYARAAADAYGRCADALAQLDEAQRAAAPLKQLDLPSGAVLLARRVELLQRAQAAPTDVLAVTRRAAEQHPTDAGVARLHVEALLAAGQADEAWRASQPFLYDAASREDFTGLAVRSAAEAGRLDAWLAELARAVHDGAPPAMPRALAAELASGPRAAAAVPLWQALLARQPDDAHLAWVLANTLRATGRLEEALLVLVRLVRANPDITLLPDDELAAWVRGPVPTAELLALIERYATAPERDYAVDAVFGLAAAAAEQDLLADQLLAAAATARPAAALPRLAWPQVYLARHRWADALRLLELAVSDQPELAAAHALLGRACVGLDDHARAEAAFAAAVQYAPDSACHARRLGEYHLDRGNLASAQRHLQQAFTLDPTDGLALERAVEAYVAGSKFEIAQAQVDAARAAGRVPADSLRRSATLVRFADALYGAAHRDALARQHAAHPQDIGTAQRLVVAHYLADDDDAALAVLRDVLAQRPDDDEALLLLARVQTRRLEFGEVIAALARLAERYPNRHEVAVALALACRNDFQPERERAVLQRLIDTVPGRDTAWRLRSQLLESHLLFGEFDAALALLDEWVALPGGAAIVPPERARTLLMADRPDDAVAVAGAFLAADPDDAERRLLYYTVLMAAADYEPLIAQLEAWRAQTPDDPRWVRGLAEALLADEQPDEAIAALTGFTPRTLAVDLELRSLRARCVAAAGQLDDAVEQYRRLLLEDVVRLSPDQQDGLRRDLLQVLIDAGESDRALAELERWLTETPDAALRRLQMLVYQAAGRQDEYEAVGATLLAEHPDDPGLNNDLGYTWLEAGRDIERATAMVRRAVVADPLQAAYLDSLGWAYYRQGAFAPARAYLSRAARLHAGQDPVIYDHLGDAEYRLGQVEAARRAWSRARELAGQRAPATLPAELLERVAAKLAALEQGTTPPVAPLVTESQEDDQPRE